MSVIFVVVSDDGESVGGVCGGVVVGGASDACGVGGVGDGAEGPNRGGLRVFDDAFVCSVAGEDRAGGEDVDVCVVRGVCVEFGGEGDVCDAAGVVDDCGLLAVGAVEGAGRFFSVDEGEVGVVGDCGGGGFGDGVFDAGDRGDAGDQSF